MEFSESFILGLIASVGGLIGLIFNKMRKSRCSNISCCWGCFDCDRDNLTLEEIKEESKPEEKNTI